MKTFIIEHLEPKLWKWCEIEYKNISKLVGKENVWFTNIKDNGRKLVSYGKVFGKSVRTMQLKNSCILDPDAKETLTPEIAKNYEYFIFGGILGDEKFNWRTRDELTKYMKNIPAFNLGNGQFSTDNAVLVTNEIIKGKELGEIEFKDELEIKIKKGESIILPYRYPLINGRAQISSELVRYLKKKKDF
ncbi:MAG: SAM-dependent methyltransferase [Nanoarchaeota archaeon]